MYLADILVAVSFFQKEMNKKFALALATRMETRLPWRPTRGSLTSPSYLVKKRTLGPPLENNPKTPPSSRDEGLRLSAGF